MIQYPTILWNARRHELRLETEGTLMITMTIGENEKDQRVDRYLLKLLSQATRAQVFSWIRKKTIRVNGKSASENQRLLLGDTVELRFSDEAFKELSFQKEMPMSHTYKLDIVYEDEEILVVNKPAGLLTHPDKEEYVETLSTYVLSYLKPYCTRMFKPASIQRLDKNTSGMVLFGKTYDSVRKYNAMMRERQIHKYYQCIAEGKISKSGEICGYLYKDEDTNKVSIVSEPDDRHSLYVQTRYNPIASTRDYTLVEVELLTGRSHQIRASLAAIGHPIYGDSKYGAKSRIKKNQVLHAYKLEFEGRTLTCPNPEGDKLWRQLTGGAGEGSS